jgi:hypothetical protein
MAGIMDFEKEIYYLVGVFPRRYFFDREFFSKPDRGQFPCGWVTDREM